MALVKEIQTASRQYCHRQMTWARGLPLFHWVDAGKGADSVVEQIAWSLASSQHTGDAAKRMAVLDCSLQGVTIPACPHRLS